MDSGLIGALIGIIGVFAGLLLSEYFRRKSRVEKFTEAFFTKKIELYEKLFEDYLFLNNLFTELVDLKAENDKKKEIWQKAVMEFLGWTDKKFLFFNDELLLHLSLTLLSAGEVFGDEENKTLGEIQREFGQAKLLIKKSLGIEKIEKNFNSAAATSISSDYIKYYRSLKLKI